MKLNTDILKNGIYNNILVYDQDAEAGVFTQRLVSLIRVTFGRFTNHSLDRIYVPEEADSDIMLWHTWVENNNIMSIDTSKPIEVFGAEIVFYENTKEISNFYKNEDCYFPGNDTNLIVAESDSVDKCLLGSY